MLKEEIFKELYELYKQKIEEATSIWKSECCCISEDEDRDKEDKEELEYFESLLNKLRLILYKKNEVINMIDEFSTASQGWQCPICKRVYSPMTPICYYCGGERETITYTTSAENIEIAKMNKHAPIHPQQQIGG